MATFGQVTQGSVESQSGGNLARGTKYTHSERGQVSSMSMYAKVFAAGTVNIIFGIYADNAGSPGVFKGATAATSFTNTSQALITANFASHLDLIAGDYWLMWNNDAGTGTGGLQYTSETEASREVVDNETYPAFNTTYSVDSTLNNRITIYATYTPGAPVTNEDAGYAFIM